MPNEYPRDFYGYGGRPPHPQWPGNARVAVQFVVNYEEGGENCILHGDDASESFLSEMVGAPPVPGMRHMNMESIYEYGSRSGFWRLLSIFSDRDIPVTAFGVASAMERNVPAVEAMLKAGWEIASHGYRWIDYQHVPIEIEKEHFDTALDVHRKLTGELPKGWYLGRCSPNSHAIASEYGRFAYNADSYADDLPFWETRFGAPMLMVPYTLDSNDMRFATPQGFNSPEQFFNYLKEGFDVLYREGESAPKMMSIGLHCRLAGRPARAAAVAQFADYVLGHDRVWLATRLSIAQHWTSRFPAPQ